MKHVNRIAELAIDERVRTAADTGAKISTTIRNIVTGMATLATIVGGIFFAQTRTPNDAASQPPAVIDLFKLDSIKGKLAFETNFASDIGTAAPAPAGVPPPTEMRVTKDGIDLIARGGAYAPIPLKRTMPTRNLTELDLVTAPGTEMIFNWTIRSGAGKSYLLSIDAASEQMRFLFADQAQPTSPRSIIPSVIPLAGIAKGNTLRLALATVGTRFLVYLDGALVADATDTRVPETDQATTSIGLGALGTKGQFTLKGLRVYAVTEPLPAPKTAK